MGKNDFCCAPNCSHELSKGAVCSFHRIPAKPAWVRKAWLSNISRVEKHCVNGKTVTKDWKPSSSSRLCSCHFEEVSTCEPNNNKKKEKVVRIPTIFSHKKRTTKPPRPTRDRRRTSIDTLQNEEIEVNQVT